MNSTVDEQPPRSRVFILPSAITASTADRRAALYFCNRTWCNKSAQHKIIAVGFAICLKKASDTDIGESDLGKCINQWEPSKEL